MTKKELNEFQSFLTGGTEPPQELENRVMGFITKELHPSIYKGVTKLFVCNAIGSVLTLLLCPQYDLSLTGAAGVMPWLMDVHPAFCFFVCGFLWMLGGQFLVNLFLSWDEQRALSRYYWGVGFSFILFSILAFACFGSLTFDGWLVAWGLGAASVSSVFAARNRAKVKRVLAEAGMITSGGR